MLASVGRGPPAHADDAPAKVEDYAIHGQATFVLQGTPGFRSPYAAPTA